MAAPRHPRSRELPDARVAYLLSPAPPCGGEQEHYPGFIAAQQRRQVGCAKSSNRKELQGGFADAIRSNCVAVCRRRGAAARLGGRGNGGTATTRRYGAV